MKQKYAKMFIAMSTDFLLGGITWETYVKNTERALNGMREVQAPSKGAHCELETRKEDGL